MLSDTQISRLLDVANAACHGGNVVDARAMYAGVLALRPGFAPALMGKALSHIVVDDFDEAERLLKDEVLAAMPEDEAEMILTHNEQEIRFVLKTDFSALRGFLAEARRKGYASAQGMLLEGTIGVSHVLRMGNEAVGSIALVVPDGLAAGGRDVNGGSDVRVVGADAGRVQRPDRDDVLRLRRQSDAAAVDAPPPASRMARAVTVRRAAVEVVALVPGRRDHDHAKSK